MGMLDPDKIKTLALAMVASVMSQKDAENVKKELAMFGSSERAQTSNIAGRAVGLVVGLTVGGLVAAFLLPVAIDEIVAVDTSSWGSGASSIWDIMDLILILGAFIFFIGVALAASNRL